MSSASEAALPEGRVALRAGLPWMFIVATGSMKPLLWPGDTVEIRPCPPDQLRIGDVICVDTDDELLLHRLVGRPPVQGGPGVLTRGDRCLGPDAPRAREDVLGRAVSVKRGPLAFRIDGRVRAPLFWLAGRLWPLTAPARAARRGLGRLLAPRRDPQT